MSLVLYCKINIQVGGTLSKTLRQDPVRPGSLEDRRALLQRVLWSRQLEKAGRIREVLTYVCERSFADPSADIHEQELGEKIFGRPSGYDTAEDNIVRVTASQARKKLEQYFSGDGSSEPIIIEIPKGQYAPIFRPREAVTLAPVPGPTPAARPDRKRLLILSIACGILAITVVYLAVQLATAKAGRVALEASPNLNALWAQLLPSNGRTDLVVTDSSLSFFQELLPRQLTLAEYLHPETWSMIAKLDSNPELRSFAHRAAQHRFTSLANVTFAYRLAKLGGNRVSLFSARDFNIRQMQSDNVILLGSTRANPWVEVLGDRLRLRYGFDQSLRYSYFENRSPVPGEQRLYRSDAATSLCQIALLPNLSQSGYILVIAGSEVEGTEAGGEFLTNERSVAQLTSAILKGRAGKLPPFEVLLKGIRVGGLAPRFEIVYAQALQP